MGSWVNWSGAIRFTPAQLEKPATEADLQRIVREAARAGRQVRAVGAGHSSSPILNTNDVLVSFERLNRPVWVDDERQEALLGAGMRLWEAGDALGEAGLAMENLGDINMQALAGAVGTGTHGTGLQFGNLSTQMIGARMVTAGGELVEWSGEESPDLLRAARVSLGLLGFFTAVRLRLIPAVQLRRREFCTHIDECMENLPRLVAENRNFDFYWYPRSDEAKLRTWNVADDDLAGFWFGELDKDVTGLPHEALSEGQELRYHETEFSVPLEAGPECFQAIRQRMKEKHRQTVAWRMLYRTIAADDSWLSPQFGRPSVAITIHQNQPLAYEEVFRDLQAIFRSFDGRPHWGKTFYLGGDELRGLYPQSEAFRAMRREMDPRGAFLNPFLRELFE